MTKLNSIPQKIEKEKRQHTAYVPSESTAAWESSVPPKSPTQETETDKNKKKKAKYKPKQGNNKLKVQATQRQFQSTYLFA